MSDIPDLTGIARVLATVGGVFTLERDRLAWDEADDILVQYGLDKHLETDQDRKVFGELVVHCLARGMRLNKGKGVKPYQVILEAACVMQDMFGDDTEATPEHEFVQDLARYTIARGVLLRQRIIDINKPSH